MEVVITQAPMETTQLLGGSVMFTCVATGIPLPTITWSSDNLEMIMPSNTTQLNDTTIFSEISINNIDMEDFVNYTCSAVNGFNTVRETAALINASMIISLYRITWLSCNYCCSNTDDYSAS